MSEILPQSALSGIAKPSDVSALGPQELAALAEDLRRVIIERCSATGGHLAPSLGVVELTLALFKAFNFERDKLIWDVGHQAYAHKLLTGRAGRFHTLRQLDGVSGFPRMAESPFDHFGVGHSSTSISAALGMALARDLGGEKHEVVSVIGDGSMTAGLAYEGLNQAGYMGRRMVVVLNDNEMSISKNVGALSRFLSRKLSQPAPQRFKRGFEAWLQGIPRIGQDLATFARRSEDSLKSFFTPGMLFEAFRFTYVGPIDGHDIPALVDVFEQTKGMDRPVLVHVLTKKGMGYKPAETNPTYFHGVGGFEPETGLAVSKPGGQLSYTDVLGQSLCREADEDGRVVAITAAMPEGTGTDCFRARHPERFVDVGICEPHAVTFAAGLATQGKLPAVCIYSTFLQRSYDQIVHDVCLQNLPVKFFLDRAGLVGEDGATHHGVYDIAYLRHIPNLTFMAPADEAELSCMVHTAFATPGPVAVRYPRGVGVGAEPSPEPACIPFGQGVMLREGRDVLVLALGSRVYPALEGAQQLEEEAGISVAVFNARFIKPLPEEQILELVARFDSIVTAEEGCLAGGFGSAVLELLADRGLLGGKKVVRVGVPDAFIEHGKPKELRAIAGIDTAGLKKAMREAAEKA